MIKIMEISTAPYLLKILQPKAPTKAIQATLSSHRHRHTQTDRQTDRQTHTHTQTHTQTHAHIHAHTHTHSHTRHHLRMTCHQNTHTKRLKSNHWSFIYSLSPPPSTRPCTGAGHMQSHRRKSRVSS